MKALIKRVVSTAVDRLINDHDIVEDIIHGFIKTFGRKDLASAVAEEIASDATDQIAENIELDVLAQHLDPYEIAGNLDLQSIAEAMDHEEVAHYVDMEEVIPPLAKRIDYAALAEAMTPIQQMATTPDMNKVDEQVADSIIEKVTAHGISALSDAVVNKAATLLLELAEAHYAALDDDE
jgi:hypothetical protein